MNRGLLFNCLKGWIQKEEKGFAAWLCVDTVWKRVEEYRIDWR